MTKQKKTVLIFNVIIAAVCLFAIIAYCTMPFLQIKIGFTITAETLEDMMGEEGDGGTVAKTGNTVYADEESSGSTFDISDIDYKEIVGEDGIPFNSSISITSDVLIKSFSLTENEVKDFVREGVALPNVKQIVEDLKEPIITVVNKTVRELTKVAVKEALNGFTDEDVNAILTDAGIDITSNIDAIFDEFEKDGATIDSLVDVLVDQIDDVTTKLANADYSEFADVTVSEEDKAQMKEELNNIFAELNLVDDNGEIKNMEAALVSLLKQALDSENQDSDDAAIQGQSVTLFSAEQESTETITDEEEIATMLTDMLMESFDLTDEAAATVSIVFKVIGILYVFSIAIWAYILLKILVKLLCKNSSVKIGVAIWWGWLMQVICFAVNILITYLPAMSGGEAAAAMAGASIALASSALYAMFAAIALFIIWIPYSRARRNLKYSISK